MNEVWAYFGGGVVVGAGVVYLVLYGRLVRAEARLRAELERGRWTEEAKATMAEAFRVLARQHLEEVGTEILREAERIAQGVEGQLERTTAPLGEALSRLERSVIELGQREAGLLRELELLRGEQGALRQAALELREALKSERGRGLWGELQLRRVVELAGMTEHVDFDPQVPTPRGRPDLVVYLPGGGVVPVDAKVPLSAYLKALSAPNERERAEWLKAHARALRERIRELAQKSYWKAFPEAPELVVAFVPSEAALHAAFEADPELLDWALAHRVLPASPVTLLALLKSVAYGWRQAALAREARRVAEVARQVLERLGPFHQHLSELGRHLGRSVEAYNRAVGSYERRLLPLVERLEAAFGEQKGTLPEPLDARPRDYGGESSK